MWSFIIKKNYKVNILSKGGSDDKKSLRMPELHVNRK